MSRLLCPLVLWVLATSSGCRKGINGPTYFPEEAGKKALAQYDTNHDGFLDPQELERCPALKNSLRAIDANGDGRLSAQEISQRVASYQKADVALTGVDCRVFLDGAPLGGARVTWEPEKFLGTGVKPASGVSEADGYVELRAEGESAPGMHFGFYRVRISKTDGTGKELLPARYNTATTLGREIAPFDKKNKRRRDGGSSDEEDIVFDLKNR